MFKEKSVKLLPKDLHLFTAVTQRGWMGCRLERLTIIGIASTVFEPGNEEQQESYAAAHLTKAFTQLRANSPLGCLRSLTLVVQRKYASWIGASARDDDDWQIRWKRVRSTAGSTASALQASALAVEELDLFGPTNDGDWKYYQPGVVHSLSETRCLQSLSPANSKDVDFEYVSDILARHLRGVAEASPKFGETGLEKFRLGLARFHRAEEEERAFFDTTILAKMTTPFVTSVCLRGIFTSENALLAFFQTHARLRHITLEKVFLQQGRFRPVFDFLVDKLELDSFFLFDLMENRILEYLSESGNPNIPAEQHESSALTLRRRWSKVEQPRPIRYKVQMQTGQRSRLWPHKNCLRQTLSFQGPDSNAPR